MFVPRKLQPWFLKRRTGSCCRGPHTSPLDLQHEGQITEIGQWEHMYSQSNVPGGIFAWKSQLPCVSLQGLYVDDRSGCRHFKANDIQLKPAFACKLWGTREAWPPVLAFGRRPVVAKAKYWNIRLCQLLQEITFSTYFSQCHYCSNRRGRISTCYSLPILSASIAIDDP